MKIQAHLAVVKYFLTSIGAYNLKDDAEIDERIRNARAAMNANVQER